MSIYAFILKTDQLFEYRYIERRSDSDLNNKNFLLYKKHFFVFNSSHI